MKSVHRNLSAAYCIFVLMLMAEISFSQEKNPTFYPYGGVPDSSRIVWGIARLNFTKALFDSAHFDYYLTNFGGAHFDSTVGLFQVHFDSIADFRDVRFTSMTFWANPYFDNIADFRDAQFDSAAVFGAPHFGSLADFRDAHFKSEAILGAAEFKGNANFVNARFVRLVLTGATIEGEFRIGLDTVMTYLLWAKVEKQRCDFSGTNFLTSARLVLHEPVDLIIQPEKFKYLSLEDTLDYFKKKNIIENLKSKSFANDKSAQFELEYIFAKSTMYQEQTGEYVENKWYETWKWPKWLVNTIYYWTMGLGYRPFRLIWWMLAITSIYTAILMKKIPGRINAYISNPDSNSTGEEKKELHLSLWETLLNCAYFSVMVFFTFRLKRDILTFFDAKEKRLIVAEWVIGFLVYVAFLTLSKSGSILHNLKELFVG